ncbi:MAG: nascent polypeptide-associated complex protein [Thermoplasmata archaeon]|nr:nascent polypeptide-associated complex protein [Thermoplasmata archaeon]
MMPGMRGVNPRQMKQAMKKMGIVQEDMEGVNEVIIKAKGETYVFKKPEVQVTIMQGQKTFQIVGDHEIIKGDVDVTTTPEPAGIEIPDEDVELVASQANVSPEAALAALEECNGELAEAIIKLMSR